jgi:dipeptidyl-peptidase-4
VFRAGVAVAPVTDWQQYDTAYTERYMGTPAENPDGYRAGSPVTYAAQLQRPLLLVHGTGDDNVHFGNTTEFVDRLIGAGRYARWVRLLALPGRGHPISDRAAQLELYHAMLAFFERELGGVSR